MNTSTAITIGVIVAIDLAIGAAILYRAIKRALPTDNWTETPPFTYIPPQPPCKAVREVQDIERPHTPPQSISALIPVQPVEYGYPSVPPSPPMDYYLTVSDNEDYQ